MTEENNISNWIQDNLRILISIGMVALLIFAIYSYSKRNSRTDVVVDDSQVEEVAMTDESTSQIDDIIDEIKDEEMSTSDEDAVDITEITEEVETQTPAQDTPTIQEQTESTEAQDSTEAQNVIKELIESHSKQKDGMTIVVAIKGDSVTTLARKAAADYITKNNISDLTPAHKIYIEDYLRKAQPTTRVVPGMEMGFSNDLIAKAIDSSRTLTDAQLANLDFYARKVSTL